MILFLCQLNMYGLALGTMKTYLVAIKIQTGLKTHNRPRDLQNAQGNVVKGVK